MNILLVGSGGREHALARRLATSAICGRLYATPGNPGIGECATLVDGLPLTDGGTIARWAVAQEIHLAVIGPEAPLAAGVADALRAAGIAVFGPSAAAARLEASKSFTKQLCSEAHIPTASYRHFEALAPALDWVRGQALPIVVKADGLAAGKGVTVAHSHAEAEEALRNLFAEAGAEVVIEEFLAGEEVSFFVVADGKTALPLLAAQDYKQVGEGDSGANTGGMGAIAPVAAFTPAIEARVMAEIVQPTLDMMRRRGTPFTGVLFCGLMLTAAGPKLIEYNVRFGDPECQVLMELLNSDVGELLWAAANGQLASVTLDWRAGHAAIVVLAARGYPQAPKKGGRITGLDKVPATGATVLHAGTALNADGQLVASGGRVLGVVARGDSIAQAVAGAYAGIDCIDYADGFCRRDIGWRAIARK